MTEEKIVDPNITSDDKTWALLSYLFTPLVPLILLLIEDKKNRPFLKAHYPQAMAWGVVLYLIATILSFTVVLVPVSCIIAIAAWVFNIIWGIKAYNGEYVEIPVITDFVKNQGWSE
jgi:uncharacterized membrane protein